MTTNSKMSNLEIDRKMTVLVKTERKITREILELIRLAETQRLPEERGFKNTHQWLIVGHGYSGGAANRRIQAARFLRDVPEAAGKVEAGDVNLTTLWQAQKSISAQQKVVGKRVSVEQKRQVLSRIEKKTSEVVERELDLLFPEAHVVQQKTVHKAHGGLTLTLSFTGEDARELERARELLSHALPDGDFSAVIVRLATEFNDRHDPLRKKERERDKDKDKDKIKEKTKERLKDQTAMSQRDLAPTPRCSTRFSPRATLPRPLRFAVIRRANGRCEYVDSVTGRKCESAFQVEVDHIVPRAKGGADELYNLRCLCRRHNQFVAERSFGVEFMASARRGVELGLRV